MRFSKITTILLAIVAATSVTLPIAGQFPEEAVELVAETRVALESSWRTVGVQRDGAGNYYVLNEADGIVWIYDKDFVAQGYTAVWGETERQMPRDFAVTADGKIVIVDWSRAGEVIVYGKDGTVLSRFAFPRPWGVATLASGEILVSGFQKGQLVSAFSQDGTPLWSFGALAPIVDETNRNAFLNVGRLVVDGQDNVYYGFSFLPEPTIRKYSRSGQLLAELRVDEPGFARLSATAREDLKRMSFGGSILIEGFDVDKVTGDLWVAISGGLVQMDPHGAVKGVYRLRLVPEMPASARNVLVEQDRLVVTFRRQGVWIFPKPQ